MESEPVDESDLERLAWTLLLGVRQWVDSSKPNDRIALRYDTSIGQVRPVIGNAESADITLNETGRWIPGAHLNARTIEILEFYLPCLGTPDARQHVIAHLGQSLDAQIATASGDAFFVTGQENRKHLHRLRALCHAVIVGAGTVLADDPQLTTRAVTGENPVRVVIDPGMRLSQSAGIFTDEAAQTLIIHDERLTAPTGLNTDSDAVVYLPLPFKQSDGVPVALLIEALQKRGLSRLFIEGGGVTVSRFLRQGSVDRLQIAVAPLIVGAGRAALQMPPVDRMTDALRPPYRVYRMGEDVLWEFNLSDSSDNSVQQVIADSGQYASQSPSVERMF